MERFFNTLMPIASPTRSLWDPRGWVTVIFNLAWAIFWVCLAVYCVRRALAWPI